MFGIENQANNFGYSAGLLANTLTNRPAQAALGTLFIGTDNLIIYRWNGAAWITIGGGGGVFGGATNGLQILSGQVGLGGTLVQNTDIDCGNYNFKFQIFDSFAIGNSTEPTMIFNTVIGTIKTSNQGNDIGLKLDFANNSFILGDYNDIYQGTNLYIGIDQINIAVTNTGNPISFLTDGANQIIKTAFGGSDIGLYLDFGNDVYTFGNNMTGFNFLVGNTSAYIAYQGLDPVLLASGNYNISLGDVSTGANGTSLTINDTTQKINLQSLLGLYNLSNLQIHANNAAALAAGLVVGDLYYQGAGNLHVVF